MSQGKMEELCVEKQVMGKATAVGEAGWLEAEAGGETGVSFLVMDLTPLFAWNFFWLVFRGYF